MNPTVSCRIVDTSTKPDTTTPYVIGVVSGIVEQSELLKTNNQTRQVRLNFSKGLRIEKSHLARILTEHGHDGIKRRPNLSRRNY